MTEKERDNRKPTHLNKRAYWKYEELLTLVKPIMKDGDENLLAVLANSYITYRDAYEVLSDRGIILAGDTMTRQNPAVNVVKDTIKTIESLSSHFGLSPKSRGDSLVIVEKIKDDLDKLTE